jgi:hypothetical protein
MACLFFIPIPVPLNWIAAAGGLMIGLAFYPFWWRRMANQLCATAWAKDRGYNPATLRFFPFGSTGIMLMGVVILLIMAVLWWQIYRPEGVWLPWLAPASIKEAGGGPSIRVTDVSQHGQTVLVRIVCDQIPHGGELAPVFAGPLIELPYVLPAAVTNVDCLIMPAPHTYVGKTIVGTNVLSGKPDFLLGFMLPDEQAAAAAVKQVQKLNLGQQHGVDSPLFVLRRNLGKDANGKPIHEEIVCWIGMQAKSTPKKSKTAALKLAFGPVVERVMTDIADNPAQACLDFGSGEWHVPPPDLAGQLSRFVSKTGPENRELKSPGSGLYDWLASNHVDLISYRASDGGARFKVLGEPVTRWYAGAETFDTVQLDEVIQRVQQPTAFPKDNPRLPTIHFSRMELDQEPWSNANFFSFRTYNGRKGLMEILGASDNPRGVKLCYKLVQNGGGKN